MFQIPLTLRSSNREHRCTALWAPNASHESTLRTLFEALPPDVRDGLRVAGTYVNDNKHDGMLLTGTDSALRQASVVLEGSALLWSPRENNVVLVSEGYELRVLPRRDVLRRLSPDGSELVVMLPDTAGALRLRKQPLQTLDALVEAVTEPPTKLTAWTPSHAFDLEPLPELEPEPVRPRLSEGTPELGDKEWAFPLEYLPPVEAIPLLSTEIPPSQSAMKSVLTPIDGEARVDTVRWREVEDWMCAEHAHGAAHTAHVALEFAARNRPAGHQGLHLLVRLLHRALPENDHTLHSLIEARRGFFTPMEEWIADLYMHRRTGGDPLRLARTFDGLRNDPVDRIDREGRLLAGLIERPKIEGMIGAVSDALREKFDAVPGTSQLLDGSSWHRTETVLGVLERIARAKIGLPMLWPLAMSTDAAARADRRWGPGHVNLSAELELYGAHVCTFNSSATRERHKEVLQGKRFLDRALSTFVGNHWGAAPDTERLVVNTLRALGSLEMQGSPDSLPPEVFGIVAPLLHAAREAKNLSLDDRGPALLGALSGFEWPTGRWARAISPVLADAQSEHCCPLVLLVGDALLQAAAEPAPAPRANMPWDIRRAMRQDLDEALKAAGLSVSSQEDDARR